MTQSPDSSGADSPASSPTLWVYGFEMTLAAQPLTKLRRVIAQENRAAKRSGRTWTARLIRMLQRVRVMIVSCSPEPEGAGNRRIAAELVTLGVDFVALVPMKVTGATPDCQL
jgi:hypothetical protein